MKKRSPLVDSVKKLQEETGASDDDTREALHEILKGRNQDYWNEFFEKYPKSLTNKFVTFYQTLSDYEKTKSPEMLLRSFVEEHPSEVSSADMRSLFAKTGTDPDHLRPRKTIKDPFDEPVRDVDQEHYEKTGEKREIRKPKPKDSRQLAAEAIENLSESDLRKMPSDKLGALMTKAGLRSENVD
jgi:hypothetical protein